MKTNVPDALVRLNIHLRRDQLSRLATLADQVAKRRRRPVRLGEALEAALIVSCAWSDSDLLGLLPSEKDAPYWLQLGPIHGRDTRSRSINESGQAGTKQ